MICPYCSQPATLVYGKAVYPQRKHLWKKMFWACKPRKAWVGCHPGTVTPLGNLADADLRAARAKAHEAFDPLWDGGLMTRTQAYIWLANRIGLRREDVHIGRFNAEQCQRVIDECSNFGEGESNGNTGSERV
jgi:zinc-finger-containing domain